jgi:hypothetical protein
MTAQHAFIPQTLTRDVRVRQKVLQTFNKRSQDFETRLEYDDYLEQREHIVFNLIEGIDVGEQEQIVAKEKRQFMAEIKERALRNAEEDRQLMPDDVFVKRDDDGIVGKSGGDDDDEAMRYEPNVRENDATKNSSNVNVVYTNYDDQGEDGKRNREQDGMRACGFDPLRTEYERSVREAFASIRI